MPHEIKIRFNETGMKEVMDLMKIKAPVMVEKLAMNVVANVAAIGRKEEQQGSGVTLGVAQHTVRKGVVDEGVFTRQSRAGFVSTRFTTSTGPFRMASFGWELARRPKTKRAGYTNQLANLFAFPAHYDMDSPFVGQKGGRYKQWKAGEDRPARYNWTRTEQIMQDSVGPAIARTMAEWGPRLKEL